MIGIARTTPNVTKVCQNNQPIPRTSHFERPPSLRNCTLHSTVVMPILIQRKKLILTHMENSKLDRITLHSHCDQYSSKPHFDNSRNHWPNTSQMTLLIQTYLNVQFLKYPLDHPRPRILVSIKTWRKNMVTIRQSDHMREEGTMKKYGGDLCNRSFGHKAKQFISAQA